MEGGLTMLSRIRCAATSPESNDHLEKMAIIELQPDAYLAYKMYLYSLIKTALQDPVRHVKPDCARVLVFDGQYLFNEREFIRCFVAEPELLEQVQLFRAEDDGKMLMYLGEHFKVNLACNLNCQLIVIIANKSEYFPQLLESINKMLFTFSLPSQVVLVVDQLERSQLEYYRQKSSCEIIRCKLQADDNNKTEEVVDPRKVQLLITSNNKDSSVLSKVIEMR